MAKPMNKPYPKDEYTANNDGWKHGESKTGAPGEKAALRDSKSPYETPQVARPDVAGMTGKMSQPAPEKGSCRTTVRTVKLGSSADGQVKAGSDTSAYLGHFRNAEVLKRGHNQGAPGGPVIENPPLTPPPPSAVALPGAITGPMPPPRGGALFAAGRKATGTSLAGDVAGMRTARQGVRAARKELMGAKTGQSPESVGTAKSALSAARQGLGSARTQMKKNIGARRAARRSISRGKMAAF